MIYLITSGETTSTTRPHSREYSNILSIIEAAVASEIPLIQLREKNLSARVLHELAVEAVGLTRDSESQLLINDRFDIALASGAAGVQLTSQSVSADVVRATCGDDFLIGASTHSLAEALDARDKGADFVLFGPIFETESKREFGPPQGLAKLREVNAQLNGFPVVAIGGISDDNVAECFSVGVAGVAAIGLFRNTQRIGQTVTAIRAAYERQSMVRERSLDR